MADPRLGAVDNFVAKRHSIPDEIQPERFVLGHDLTVCIIGAGQGIGKHIAFAYAKAGVTNIIIAARTISDLDETAASIGEINSEIRVMSFQCDVASASSVKDLSEMIKSEFGRLDVLICNAAYPGPVILKMEEGQPEWVQQAFNVNAMGTYHAAHYLVPLLLATENGAKAFLAIGTAAGMIRRGSIANTGYCVSKMAQIRLVEFLNEQHGADGLFALTIHPGAVATPNAVKNGPEEFMPYLIDPIDLCGAVCVWITSQLKELDWLSGRFIMANWDLEELVAKRETIVQKDLLKLTMAVE